MSVEPLLKGMRTTQQSWDQNEQFWRCRKTFITEYRNSDFTFLKKNILFLLFLKFKKKIRTKVLLLSNISCYTNFVHFFKMLFMKENSSTAHCATTLSKSVFFSHCSRDHCNFCQHIHILNKLLCYYSVDPLSWILTC